MPDCRTRYLPEGVSDHNPVHDNLVNKPQKNRKMF